jgi:hypothetical protein
LLCIKNGYRELDSDFCVTNLRTSSVKFNNRLIAGSVTFIQKTYDGDKNDTFCLFALSK